MYGGMAPRSLPTSASFSSSSSSSVSHRKLAYAAWTWLKFKNGKLSKFGLKYTQKPFMSNEMSHTYLEVQLGLLVHSSLRLYLGHGAAPILPWRIVPKFHHRSGLLGSNESSIPLLKEGLSWSEETKHVRTHTQRVEPVKRKVIEGKISSPDTKIEHNFRETKGFPDVPPPSSCIAPQPHGCCHLHLRQCLPN